MAFPKSADADPSQWFFKDPVKNSAQGRSVYVKESSKSKKDVHVIQGELDTTKFPYYPNENCPTAIFGLYPPRDSLERRCLELAIRDPADIKFWQDTDEQVIKTAVANAKQWFGKEIPEDKLRDRYQPVLRAPSESFVDPDGKEIPAKTDYTVRATIMDTADPKHWERTIIKYASYDKDGKLVYRDGNLSEGIPRHSQCVAIYRFSSVNFTRSEFNLALKYKGLIIWPGEETSQGIDMFGLGVPIEKMSDDEVEASRQQLQQHASKEETAAVDNNQDDSMML